MKIREILIKYKKATENFIEEINKGEDPQRFIAEREEMINEMKKISFSKEELKLIVEDIQLLELEKEAYNALYEEKEKIKNEIIQLKKAKDANFTYGNQYRNIGFIDKQI